MPTPNLTPIKSLSPREQFREHADSITKHRNLVDLPEFQRAAQYAMLEFQALLSAQVKDANSALAVGYKLQGGLELISILRNLAEPTPALPKIVNQQLNHHA